MKLLVFSVFDNAVKAYNAPIFMRTRMEAIRAFSQSCKDEASQFFKFHNDYSLFELGSYDDATGTFAGGLPERVITATECLDDQVFPPEKRVQ